MKIGKKIWKIIIATLLLIPLFAGALGVNAADDGTADVTLHKRVFKDELPTEKENTGMIDLDFGGDPLPGAEFTVYDVTTQYHAAIVGSTQQAAMDNVIAAYDANPSAFGTGLATVVTSTPEGEALFANLPLKSDGKDAAYLFVETNTPTTPTITQKAAPFILAMPIFTSKGADGVLNTDIHVYPKNVTADNEKEMTNAASFEKITINGIEHPNVQIGDTLSYKLTIHIPTDIAKLTSFVVEDTPGIGMVLANNPNVQLNNAASLTGATITATPGAKSLIVALDPANSAIQALAGQMLTITYDMVLTSDAPVDTSIENNASITIDGETTTEITPPPGVITNGKQFIKKDAHTGKELADAKFKVYKNDGTSATDWAKYTLVNGAYVFAGWGTEADATEVQSGTDGIIRLKGMIEGTYYLKETAAPEGYVLLVDPFEFEIVNGQSGSSGLIPVDNVPKGLLPSTGGSGIYAFLIIGAMMMGGAYIWFKRSKEQAEV